MSKRESKQIACRLLPLLMLLPLAGCHRHVPIPKPQAYLRIDLPEADYRQCDTAELPFTFDISRYAHLEEKHSPRREAWADIVYPQWQAVVFLSYKQLATPSDLRGQVDTSLRLLETHYQFASGVDEQHFVATDSSVFATVCRLQGSRVASTCQFWATDSVHHFLRGALYLDRTPNNDSLAPIIGFVQADIERLVESLRWR